MTWASPEYLWGLLLLIPFAFLCWKFVHIREEALLKIGMHGHVRHWIRSFCFFGVGMIFVIVALARPRNGYELIEFNKEQRDIVIVLDVSRSMLAKDVLPSRIDRAQWEIRTLIEGLQGERVALVIFANRAFVRMPLSKEYGVFLDLMHESHPEKIHAQGSDLATALQLAGELFSTEKGARSIVLVSDGEDHTKGLKEVGNFLTEHEISVYSLAIGTKKGGVLPRAAGGYVLDNRGDIVMSRRMDNVLQDISKQTGGRFTVSQAGREDWDVLYEEGIKKQAANGTQKDEERIWKELFVWPLGVGFLSFIGAYGVRVMGSGMILFFILCIQPVHAGEDILDPQDNRSMERFALSLYEDGDFRSAERLFIDLSVEGGARGIRDRARHNAALAAYQQGKLVEALRYLREMERSTPLSLHNAQQIAQEIEQRREQQPQQEESPSEQAESQEQNGSGGESGEESSSSSPSPKESPSSEENESQEQSTSTDPKSEEQNQSENNTKPESSSSEAPFSTEEKEGATGTPSPITNEEEGPEVEDLEGGVPNTPISGEAGGEIGDFSMEAFSLQEAGRLIDSVEEGENRGFGQGESDSSGTKEW